MKYTVDQGYDSQLSQQLEKAAVTGLSLVLIVLAAGIFLSNHTPVDTGTVSQPQAGQTTATDSGAWQASSGGGNPQADNTMTTAQMQHSSSHRIIQASSIKMTSGNSPVSIAMSSPSSAEATTPASSEPPASEPTSGNTAPDPAPTDDPDDPGEPTEPGSEPTDPGTGNENGGDDDDGGIEVIIINPEPLPEILPIPNVTLVP